jgi:uncharacterized membrane protein
MNIIRNNKKLIGISLCLIIAGILITGIGFGIQGSGLNSVKENQPRRWYQTIRIDDGTWSYGLDFTDNIHLFKIEN